MRVPYIGVTGVTHAGDVEMIRAAADDLVDTGRRIMVGLLVSNKTLRGDEPSAYWRGRYPKVEVAEAIWAADTDEPALMKTVHYNSKDAGLDDQLEHLVELLPSIEAIQLNIYRPSIDALQGFRAAHPDIGIILQAGNRVLAEFDTLSAINWYLDQYTGLADWVLLDPSGGQGRDFQSEYLAALLEIADWDRLGMLPGVARGLEAATISRLRPLLERWPVLSWDAEGRLLIPDGGLHYGRSTAYLQASRELLGV